MTASVESRLVNITNMIDNIAEEYDFDTNDIKIQFLENHLRASSLKAGVSSSVVLLSPTNSAWVGLIKNCYPNLAKLASDEGELADDIVCAILEEAINNWLVDLEDEDAPMFGVDSEEDLDDSDSLDDSEEEDSEEVIAEEEEEEEDIGLTIEVETNTGRVMNVYRDLFRVGFELKKPFGILTSQGALSISKGETKLHNVTSLSKLYQFINGLSDNALTHREVSSGKDISNLVNFDISPEITYYPRFQLGNLFGVIGNKQYKTWEEMSADLEVEVKSNLKKGIQNGDSVEALVFALTNCIVISDLDGKSSISLRINIGHGLVTSKELDRHYEQNKKEVFGGVGTIFHSTSLSSGVVEWILVFNKDVYNGKPLFAYEAMDLLMKRGKKPSLKNVVLGQDTSGAILTRNLDNQQSCILLVGAGQRSGKGVLTLNLLGTVLANGSPLIYLDGKPDMAPVLWDLGRKHGQNPAVWDIFNHNGNTIGNGAPDVVKLDNSSVFGVVMYLKVLQLMMVSAGLQANGVKFLDDKRPFFVFDEALAVQMTMSAAWTPILTLAKDKTADEDSRNWAMKLTGWAEGLEAVLGSSINSQIPKSGISTVWLFQVMQPTAWSKYDISGSRKFNILKKPIESRLSLKFLGRGTSDSEYALGSEKVKLDKTVSNRVLSEGGRHFALTGSQKVTDMDSVTVFKPYLVLNESESTSKSGAELLSNLSPDVVKAITVNGELDKRAGFEGFIEMLGDEGVANLSKGRDYLEAVMAHTGLLQKYGSVEGYIYDVSVDSFYTTATIIEGIKPAYDDTLEESSLDDDDSETFGNYERFNGNQPPVTSPNESFDDDFDDTEEPEDFDTPNQTEPARQTRYNETPTPKVNSAQQSYSRPVDTGVVYTDKINLESNPFQLTRSGGSAISFTAVLNQLEPKIVDMINKTVGDVSNVTSFILRKDGVFINGIALRPTFDAKIVDSMPLALKAEVSNGNIADLFPLKLIYKFSNLQSLEVNDIYVAEGRLRRELGIHPKKSWFILFKKIRTLRRLVIAGSEIVDESTATGYTSSGRGGFEFKEALRDKLKVPQSLVSNSYTNALWNTRPVKVATSAAGWTLGVKAVAVAASFLGPWGLLLGAFAGYGAYRELKNRK